jgi:23S rRNA (cytosine1962-C5)-methyltransferase
VARTDGIRLVHGESDGIPAVSLDRFGDTLVVASYATGFDAIARYLASVASDPNVVLRAARLRTTPAEQSQPRVLRGNPGLARFVEDGHAYVVDVLAGQKTGAYLDLRGLRQSIAAAPLAGARVLNLFAYTGMLGRPAEAAGAASITHVDSSERALAFAAEHHAGDRTRHTYVTADVFTWLPAHSEMYDLVIVDPPAMTTTKAQVPAAIASYRKLYRAAASRVAPGGAVVAACCTSRIERALFHRTVGAALGPAFARERELPVELDHPVAFAQADYLKIAWWRRGR